jgi:hypothetical protein
MPEKTFEGKTPEQYFLESKQAQANGCDSSMWEYRIGMINDFGFTEGWAYELVRKLIKKYEKLGQLTTEKIWYEDGDGKKWNDLQFIWKPELLPPPQEIESSFEIERVV